MLQPFPGFCGPSYPAASVFLESSRTVNFYLERIESGLGKNEFALLHTPGTALWKDLGAGPTRGMLLAPDGKLYVPAASKLYQVTSGAVSTDLGSIGNDNLPVSLAANAVQTVAISAGLGYVAEGGVLTQITDADFPANARSVDFTDGYFIVLGADNAAHYSALNDAYTWDALDTFTVSSSANTLLRTFVAHREVIVFGDRLIQVFVNTGDLDNPFQPNAGTIQEGLAARFSPAFLDNSVFYVATSERGGAIVRRLQGYMPQRVSNHAVEAAMQSYARVDDAVGYGFQWNGHPFYRITFPTANATWQYDVSTQDWQEVLYWNGSSYEAHLGLYHAFAFGKHLVGSRITGKVYELSGTTYTDEGATIRRVRRAPHITYGDRMFYDELAIEVEPGLGLISGQGSDPTFVLRWSDDGGKTFTTPERSISVGAMGNYRGRPRAYRLGSAYDRVFETIFTDPIPWRITGAGLRTRPGRF